MQHIKMYISLKVHKHKIIDQRFWPVKGKKKKNPGSKAIKEP